jgi:hypothetical protein
MPHETNASDEKVKYNKETDESGIGIGMNERK